MVKMEVVSAIVGPVVNVLTIPIKQKLRNLTSSADRVKEMKDKMEFLDCRRVDNENHFRRNRENNLEIPARVPGWLEEVEDIKEEVEKIPSNDIGCFNVKKKYQAGRNALRLIKDMEGLIKESSDFIWTDADIPLRRVDTKHLASTSGGNTQNVFDSRVKPFNDALKLLQEDETQVIALCGMGGVGKTTLMKQLKEAAEDNKMFEWIVVVAVGNSFNLFNIQEVIAAHTGESLTETDETLRATLLSKRFQAFSERKEKILVILDDVWEKIKLEDIGLASPLPNGFKLLLTSRDLEVCRQIAVDAGSALKEVEVDILKENEAQDFFCQKAGISAEHHHDLYELGCEIVKKCGCLPLAIEIIAATLKCETNRSVWRHTLKRLKNKRLKNNDLDKNVQEIIEMSYNNLKQEEDKTIFLLCGLFPKDSNIPIEDLTRYAWGLKLLKQVSTMEAARDSIETSVSNLKNAYLLMDGDSHHSDFVKLHELVLAFVVNTVSKGSEEGCWIIHHDDFSKLSEANNMSQSCKQISLTCKGMSEFPSEFKFPNLTVLKLAQGDESLRFPEGFYVGMEQLQVIAFEKLKHTLVPTSSANLRTLCLDECSLTFDLTCIGNLSNLEVLSIANSGVTILPSTFRNLKKLRLLDVTGCCDLVIDEGVLKSLVKLEELYMIPKDEKTCCFTDNNNREFAERSKNLSALEFEFIGRDNAHMKNMSYENLERFKLSVGCSFTEVREHVHTSKVDMHSYENSLKLVTNREELLKSKINKLFMITDALYLQVNEMNTLEDVVDPPHPPQNSLFYNLRLLVVSQCAELKYLFTLSVATNLSKLEYLDISGCPNLEAVIHTENEGLLFSNLKYLRLAELPELLHFCNKVDVIELSRLMELQLEGLPKFTSIYPDSATSFESSTYLEDLPKFNLQDVTPELTTKLEKLFVKDCDSIKFLFNMDFREIEQFRSGLRSIKVDRCNSLVQLFSCNPFPFFNNLQELEVRYCASIEVIFDIDMRCVGETDSSSSLRSIWLEGLGKLREVWRIKDAGNNLIHGFEAVESINIVDCERFENLITPATTTFDMRALKKISKIAFPLPTFNNLHKLHLYDSYKDVEVVFEITSPISRESPHNTQQQLIILPYLEELDLCGLLKMSHVWKCNWNELILQKQPSQSSFRNLTTIIMIKCNSIKYLFSPLMVKLLSSLKEIYISSCDAIEEVVSNRDDEDASINSHTTASVGMVFPRLKSLSLFYLPNFVGFFLGKNEFIWPALEEVEIRKCPQITVFTCGQSTAPKLKFINTSLGKHSVECGLNFHVTTTSHQDRLSSYERTSSYRPTTMEKFPWSYHNLIEADMNNIPHGGQTLFSSDEVSQLQKLETVHLRGSLFSHCWDIEEIFDSQTDAEIPNLRQVELKQLDSLKYIWKSKQGTELKFPNLTRLSIDYCSSLEYVFTCPMVGSIMQLQELHISNCRKMKEIVKGEEESDAIVNAIVEFPCLKSLKLDDLKSLEGFCLGKEAFSFASLDTLEIKGCSKMTPSEICRLRTSLKEPTQSNESHLYSPAESGS
ncbi:resistance protein candidate RGC2 [Artemisia annua]|uniref:Resistance protein candidate RGC2 n=1 Tax=Artemisia annua TaxID=35608 RepID=A0A2U1Q6K1_ARTAN|nr:resistance protein candidate RGC2 [Artemisia annua]